MSTDDRRDSVSAEPQPELILKILTRDVDIVDTVPEFVDNSIDGANRVIEREPEIDDYSEFWIDVTVDEEHVEVKDNCGGISEDLARNYAFQFGRSPEAEEETNPELGNFGVGMKRSLFKLGQSWRVESHHPDSRFIVEITDVDQWARQQQGNIWEIDFDYYEEGDDRFVLDHLGTRISIPELREDVAGQLERGSERDKIENRVKSVSQRFIDQGMTIEFNGRELPLSPIEVLDTEEYSPGYAFHQYEGEEAIVLIEIFVGLGDRDNDKGGWYVYCNDRLVLEANQDEITGWGTDRTETIPKFHGQFNRFRGIVHFRSSVTDELPWNTSKTGMNPETGVYQFAREKMVSEMRPVINKLNEIADYRRETGGEDPPLEDDYNETGSVPATDVWPTSAQTFSAPGVEDIDPGPVMRTISYKKEDEKIRQLQNWFGVNTNRAVGIETFDYVYDSKIEE